MDSLPLVPLRKPQCPQSQPQMFFVVVVRLLSHVQLFLTLWPGFPVLHCLLEFAQTHVHCCHPAISSSVIFPSPSALNLSQHQGGSFPMSQLFAPGSQSIGEGLFIFKKIFLIILFKKFIYLYLCWIFVAVQDFLQLWRVGATL